MRIVDLTLDLKPDLPVVPGHPKLALTPINTHVEHGRSNTAIALSLHTGTHIDAPLHFVPHGAPINEVPLERLVGRAVIVDLRGVAHAHVAISPADLMAAPGFKEEEVGGAIAVLYTGWTQKMIRSPRYYYDSPYLAVETARYLIGLGIQALAVDFTQDKLQDQPRPDDCPIHRAFLSAGIPCIEHLVNVDQVPNQVFTMVALPIKVSGGDGAPARVIALID